MKKARNKKYRAKPVSAGGAFRAKLRSARSGNFRLVGDALCDITSALCVHDQQLVLATRAEVTAAMHLVESRIKEGNVYKEAA